MTKKLNLAILCGGQSAEHEISILSAKNIIAAVDKNKYKMLVVYITKAGKWFLFSSYKDFLQAKDPARQLTKSAKPLSINPGEKNKSFISFNPTPKKIKVDVIFPVLHGPNSEDGTVQGMLDLLNVPYVGPGTLSSAMCMDKEITKRLLQAQKLPTPKWLVFHKHEKPSINFAKVKQQLGLPFFIKPVNMGSSLGIAKVKSQADFNKAVNNAFRFDTKIIIEQAIVGRELECAVLGNEKPEPSKIAEIIPQHEFYSYDAKYFDPNGAVLKAPTRLPAGISKKVQALAVQAFKALECQGMARVDFFLDKRNRIFINEINTIPGFTQISMYPRLWQAEGVAYPRLVDKLITLALRKR